MGSQILAKGKLRDKRKWGEEGAKDSGIQALSSQPPAPTPAPENPGVQAGSQSPSPTLENPKIQALSSQPLPTLNSENPNI